MVTWEFSAVWHCLETVWTCTFSGLHFPVFELNMEVNHNCISKIQYCFRSLDLHQPALVTCNLSSHLIFSYGVPIFYFRVLIFYLSCSTCCKIFKMRLTINLSDKGLTQFDHTYWRNLFVKRLNHLLWKD